MTLMLEFIHQAPVVQKLDKSLSSGQRNCFLLPFYPLDSAIQRLNNRGQAQFEFVEFEYPRDEF